MNKQIGKLLVTAATGILFIASCGDSVDENNGLGTGVAQPPAAPVTVPTPLPVVPDAGSFAPTPAPVVPVPQQPIAPVVVDAGAPAPAANSDLWCNARAVLQTRCQNCH
ncbi:MAG TPA: hypothetical protein VMF89_26890, partial [Polyangiales bacterium]|nr:hypothetical protein [Polyangiales bacterium]